MSSLTNIQSIPYFIPELILVVFAIGAILLDLVNKGRNTERVAYVALAGVAATLIAVIAVGSSEQSLFLGMVRLDSFAVFFKILILVATAVTIIFSIKSEELDPRMKGEYYALLIAVTFGMFLMVSSTNLLMIFISLETVSLTSYILAGFLTHNPRSSEAAFKYITYGAVASGTMLFGLSLLFGLTGTGDVVQISSRLTEMFSAGEAYPLVVLVIITFILAGIGYKMASVPFHMWSPDVYEGAPIPITAFLSVASKAAGFGLFIRLFYSTFQASNIVGSVDWSLMLSIVSALTMTLGNLAALPQQNVKRLLAYSSIAHGGYLLMGATLLTPEGIHAILFYFIAYLFMNLGAFFVVVLIANELGSETIDGYRNLWSRAPFVAVSMAIFLFSLTGIPPFAGFFGKWLLFTAVIKQELYWMAVVGLLNSVVSLYYYARIIKAMFLETSDETDAISFSWGNLALLVVFVVPTFVIGFWNTVYEVSRASLGRIVG
ncbi:MAG: NADH-quinone oxidoreductase subunit N [Candidatus Poribacteria bacterium]|nr:NADH-quinone oxidoreductase subunit N [Candidatus Poribacteria bacterium]